MPTRSILGVWSQAALAFVLCGWLVEAGQNGIQVLQVTQIKLEAFGWKQPVINPMELDSLPSQTVTIDSKGRVAVNFTLRAQGQELTTRAKPGLESHVIRFTPDGKPDLSLALPTNNWNGNGVYLDDQDRIIARANDSLLMVSPDGQSGHDQTKQTILAPCGRRCEVFQSLSRRTLYLDTWEPEHADHAITVLNTEDLSNILHCRLSASTPVNSITDRFAYFNHDPGAPIGSIKQSPILYRWPFCDYEHRVELAAKAHHSIRAVDDDSLVFFEVPNAIVVLGADGKVKRKVSIHFSKHEGSGGVAVSASADRIAVIGDTFRGGSQLLDISAHMTAQRIIVIDMLNGDQLASIPMNPRDLVAIRIAMSPDGHRIAALVHDTVTVVDLP